MSKLEELLFLKNFLERCEKELQLPKGAVMEIPKEDDWTFVIKIAAILEKSLNNLICKDINDKKTNKVIYSLSLSEKIQHAYDRELIDQSTKLKFKFVAQVRNLAAHSIMFSFKNLFLNCNALKDYQSKFKSTWNDPVNLGKHKVPRNKFLIDNPKLTIFFEIAEKIASSEIDMEIANIKKDRDRLQASGDIFKKLISKKIQR